MSRTNGLRVHAYSHASPGSDAFVTTFCGLSVRFAGFYVVMPHHAFSVTCAACVSAIVHRSPAVVRAQWSGLPAGRFGLSPSVSR